MYLDSEAYDHECESTLESDIRLCYYLKGKKDEWVRRVGILWLNSKIPTADLAL